MRLLRSNQLYAGNAASTSWLSGWKAFYSLTKPGIVNLTLVAALAGVYVGNKGIMVEWGLLVFTLAGLALATAGACVLNNVYDRDIDRLMKRTMSRPLACDEISPQLALAAGVLMSAGGVVLMWMAVNPVAAALTALAVFGYVVLYTMIAKRRTPWANQIGGIAGALPPVIGVAAVTGQVTLDAMVLLVIMAVWQQPHALSLALKYREDYARAGVPVIPVAKGVASTKSRIFIYTILLLAVSLLPYVTGMTGFIYPITAVVMGLAFIVKAARFLVSDKEYDMPLFMFSLVYWAVMCAALVLDMSRG